MTTVIKGKAIGHYYITLSVECRYNMNYYEVTSNYYNRLDLNNVYHMTEYKKALRCFYRYCARARKNEG